LIALAALSLLGAAALDAVLLQTRMATNVASRHAVLAAADHALAEVERQFENAVRNDDQRWLDAARAEQVLPLPEWNVATRYSISFCCNTVWDFALPLSEENAAQLYHINVEAAGTVKPARIALQSTYLIAPATASLPERTRRVAWRRFDSAF
jgi:Tfp pilus assembly protein PilX